MKPAFMNKENVGVNTNANETRSVREFTGNATNINRQRPQFTAKESIDDGPITPRRTPRRTPTNRRRLIFSERSPEQTPLKRQLYTAERGHRRHNAIIFNDRRPQWEVEEEGLNNPDSPPPSKKAKATPSLASLIRTRCLELLTQPETHMNGVTIPIEAFELDQCTTWNEKTIITDEWVILNPLNLPLDRAKFVKYSHKVLTAIPSSPYP